MSLFHQSKLAEARALFSTTEAKMKPLPGTDYDAIAAGTSRNDLTLWLAFKERQSAAADARHHRMP
jgi:hypothetical protein